MKFALKSLTLAAAIACASPAFAAFPILPAVQQEQLSSQPAAAAVTVNHAEAAPAPAAPAGRQAVSIQKKQGFFAKLMNRASMAADKSQLVALLLCLLVGTLGIHRFYLGYTWQGVVQLLTFGGLGIWTLIDLIRIITGGLQPRNGSYDTTL